MLSGHASAVHRRHQQQHDRLVCRTATYHLRGSAAAAYLDCLFPLTIAAAIVSVDKLLHRFSMLDDNDNERWLATLVLSSSRTTLRLS